ncbi:CHAT domain-containing protein [Actinospica durhamensis]|uniref:CHAT domain-containing protein n=1 Tax=Actinospica durhamensis TaxID=1508375 RepID=A0A941ILU3_9ACTN|nr:CHAT domain-containing protein [Actinospica durhamensis]MBR7833400.1 CHAT domain-containing protein [Actinospica durhamensis]
MTEPFIGEYERAQAHFEAYERTGTWSELEAAVLGFRMLTMTRMDGPVANGLAVSLWSRYERLGDRADLHEAIGLLRYAVGRYASDPEHLASASNLAATLRMRWRVSGAVADLTESIELSRRVLEATPGGHPMRSARSSNLAEGLQTLYLHHGDTSALDDAVTLFRAVVEADEASGDGSVIAKSNLAEALRLRFESSRDISLLDQAVVLARAAAQASMPLLQDRFRSNLALVLLARYTATRRPEDLREAGRLAEQAVKQTPQGHPNRAERANALAQARRLELIAMGTGIATPSRFARRTRSSAQWRRAGERLAAATATAVQETPQGHPSRATALFWHGLALGFQGDDDAAVALCRQVAQEPAFPPWQRVAAARQWAYIELWRADWAGALVPFVLAVGLLPHTAPRRVTQADRERALGVFAGLASDAAACAIQSGEPESAVALLEQGRGVMLAHALDARTELTDLEEQHPDLARRFAEVRTALDAPHDPSFITRSDVDTALTGEHRHALAEEWQSLVETIRSRPGFARFLRPPGVEEMLAVAAGHGPVVMVNVSELRCDALLLRDRSVTVVPLPGLTLTDCAERAARLRMGPSEHVQEILDWLADVLTGPVLRALGLDQAAPQHELPRLWWIPTGPLAALPLHAAGDASDRVVSSYAPTLRGLISTWTAPPITRGGSDPLAVAVPSAPGVAALPAVELEVADIARKFPHARILNGDKATRESVLDALPRHSWAHFACHATSAADGFAGGLVLWDHATAPLTVADIARLRLTRAEMAYLSACETNAPPPRLADEALHVAGACHMAGFQHVIGTLWPVRDRIARSTADRFYDALLTRSPPARALHTAVRELRDTCPAAVWAAFVHVGG